MIETLTDEDIARGVEKLERAKDSVKSRNKMSRKDSFLLKIKDSIKGLVNDGLSLSEVALLIKETFAIDISKQTLSKFIRKHNLRKSEYSKDENKLITMEVTKDEANTISLARKYNADIKILENAQSKEIAIFSKTHSFDIKKRGKENDLFFIFLSDEQRKTN